MSGRDINLSPKGDPTMYILTHKQSKGISSITEKLSILRNWRNKTLAVNSFKYRTIIGGVSQKITFDHKGGGGGRRGPKSDHAILEQPLNIKLIMLFCGKCSRILQFDNLILHLLVDINFLLVPISSDNVSDIYHYNSCGTFQCEECELICQTNIN